MASIKKILPPQPHYLSGYTGFVPGYKFHCGQSYGRLTHDLFLERRVGSTPILTDLTRVENDWLTPGKKAIIDGRCDVRECKYNTDMIPGYAGHVPQHNFLCGKKFAASVAMGLDASENMKRACLCSECMPVKEYNVNERGRPLKQVAGGVAGFKDAYERRRPRTAAAANVAPRFPENGHARKEFVAGYNGHVPNLLFMHGCSYTPGTNRALRLFAERYENLMSDRLVPVTTTAARPKPPAAVSQKLPYESGMIKNYAGHIPGYKFNVAQTFGEGSKNTRTVLLGQH